MKKLFLALNALLIISCNQQPSLPKEKNINLDSIKQVLKQTDQDFSDLSKSKGQHAAFLQYMDENVAMLRPNSMPLIGKDTMQKRYALSSDTSYTLIWKPLFADVSTSGDLGYTYGQWQLQFHGGELSEGTYCTIWKQDSTGKWKFVLDMGNEGLKKPEPTQL